MHFNVRDGIGDDLSSLSDSIALRTPISLGDTLWTLGAAVAAAYVGVHAVRMAGFRTDLSGAVGSVLGLVALDASVKFLTRTEVVEP
jgi:hypothetical protein